MSSNQLPNLDKMFREEDDADFVPSGGTNLAAIFGAPQKSFESPPASKSLPPKKSEHLVPKNDAEVKTDVVIAKPVHAFKLQNGQYVSAGKLGLALTRQLTTKTYQILLYQSKQTIISATTIIAEFSYTIQKNNYASYYDQSRQLWSIAFNNCDSCIEFAREVGLSRYFCQKDKSSGSVIYQDLTYSNKTEKAKEGDRVSMKYAIATELLQPLKISSFSNEPMTADISSYDNWEKMLIGTCKELRRILILPPSKQISLGPGFPKEKDIVLEVEIVDIAASNEPTIEPAMKNDKASLLSRMAKMGHSILPKKHLSTTDSEDTEDESLQKSQNQKSDSSDSVAQKKPAHVSQEPLEPLAKGVHKVTRLRNMAPIVQSTQSSMIQPILTTPWAPARMQQQYVTMDAQLYPQSFQQSLATQPLPAALDPNLNIFLSETRTQNSEIRMGMSKIADNVQKLLDKFHTLEMQNATSPTSNSALETTMKLLLALNSSQSSTVLNSFQNSAVESNKLELLESEIRDLKCDIAARESKIKTTEDALERRDEEINRIEREQRDLQKQNVELSERIRSSDALLNSAKNEREQLHGNVKTSEARIDEYQKENEKLKKDVMDLTNHLKTLEISSAVETDAQKMAKEKNREIKTIMNKTYHAMLDQFTEETYTIDFIREIVSSTIRNITLEVLKKREPEVEKNGKNDSEESSIKESKAKTVDSLRKNLPMDTISISRDEPPPIPPMDADIESDTWIL